jgi:uncharacterized Zn finger protein (UPF0148 family)
MSHQDRDGHTAAEYNFQALQSALLWLLPSLDALSVKFRTDCSWSVRGLLSTALLWAWSDENTITGRFSSARRICIKILGRMAGGQSRKVPACTYQAFMKMLRKWTAHFVPEVSSLFRKRMVQTFGSQLNMDGYFPCAVDGTRLELPRTEANEKRYSAIPKKKSQRSKGAKRRWDQERAEKSRRKKASIPQMWLTTLWQMTVGLPWDWRTGPCNSSERAHALEMIPHLPENALVVADAGFVGYDFWKAIRENDRHFVIRVAGNVRLLRKLCYVKEHQGIVYVWPDSAATANEPPLVLRLVVVNDGRKTWHLLSSVLDQKQLSDKLIATIYALRWGIEVFYRSFKQTFSRRKLLSDSAANAQTEAQWSLLGLWAMMFHAQHVLAQKKVSPKRVSIARVLRAFRKAMREYKSCPDAGESLVEMLQEAVIDDYERGSRTSREYPRKKKEEETGPPKIFYATQKQIDLARRIKRELCTGLTA